MMEYIIILLVIFGIALLCKLFYDYITFMWEMMKYLENENKKEKIDTNDFE